MRAYQLSTAIAVFLVCFSASAGSSVANIDCKSASGRSVVEARSRDLYGVLQLGLTIDKHTVMIVTEMSDGKLVEGTAGAGLYVLNDQMVAIQSHKTDPYAFIEFWGIPGSFKRLVARPGSFKYQFRARVRGTDPRPKPEYPSIKEPIDVNCELDYSI